MKMTKTMSEWIGVLFFEIIKVLSDCTTSIAESSTLSNSSPLVHHFLGLLGLLLSGCGGGRSLGDIVFVLRSARKARELLLESSAVLRVAVDRILNG